MNERKPSLAKDYEAEIDELEMAKEDAEFEMLMEALPED